MAEPGELLERISTSCRLTADENMDRRINGRQKVCLALYPHSPISPWSQLLGKSEKVLLGHRIAHHVFDKIDAILFAIDYNLLPRDAKTRFIKTQYFIESPLFDEKDGYDVNNNWLNGSRGGPAYGTWRKKFQHETTGRNRLLNLYLFVSACLVSTLVSHPCAVWAHGSPRPRLEPV